MQHLPPLPPLYCAETQERIWPEYFGLRKAVWCNGKPYLVDVARRLRLMPDPVPPKGFEILQFGKPLPGFVQSSSRQPAVNAPRGLPPAAAFKPAEILAAVKSGTSFPAQPVMSSPNVVPMTLETPAAATPVPPAAAAANSRAEEATVITASPVASSVKPAFSQTVSPDTDLHRATAVSKPPDMDTKEFKRLELAAHALEEAQRHKKEVKHILQGPTPPPLENTPVSPAAISTLRAAIVPARMPDAPDPASYVVVVQPAGTIHPSAADSAVASLGAVPVGHRTDTATAFRLPAVNNSSPGNETLAEVAKECDASAPPPEIVSELENGAPEGATRIVLLKTLRAQQQTPPQPADSPAQE